jgi:hypothetical protein
MVGIKRLLLGMYAGVLVAYFGGFILMPEIFFRRSHQGISYYGNYFPAFIPYMIGLVAAVGCLVFASYFMPNHPKRLGVIKNILLIIAVCISGILLTPEELTPFFFYTHLYIAVALFAVAGFTALWVFMQPGRQLLDWFLLVMMVVGIIMSGLSASFIDVLGVLPWGQLLAMNGALLLIMRGTFRWLPKSRYKKIKQKTI